MAVKALVVVAEEEVAVKALLEMAQVAAATHLQAVKLCLTPQPLLGKLVAEHTAVAPALLHALEPSPRHLKLLGALVRLLPAKLLLLAF